MALLKAFYRGAIVPNRWILILLALLTVLYLLFVNYVLVPVHADPGGPCSARSTQCQG